MVGIRPVMASEVKPYPIAVTRKQIFPKMKHLGSVTEIKGDEIEPVDVVAFGSPADLSIAGNRKGLEGDQSKLFYRRSDPYRKEMRNKTNLGYIQLSLFGKTCSEHSQ